MSRPKARPKGADLPSNALVKGEVAEDLIQEEMARGLDELAAYDEFAGQLLPEIRKMLVEGATSEEILARYSPFAAARIVSIAATELDSGKALSAAKDVLDRVQGKAIERKQIAHKFANLSDTDLDAVLASAVEDLVDVTPGEDDEGDEQN